MIIYEDFLVGRESLKTDLDKLQGWAIMNCMKFNNSNCPILHSGQGNPGFIIRIGDEKLESYTAERDLGVLFNGNLNTSQHCPLAAKRTNHIKFRFGIRRRFFTETVVACWNWLPRVVVKAHQNCWSSIRIWTTLRHVI